MAMSAHEAYPHLLAPFELAGRRVKNRIAHASIALRFGSAGGMHPSYFQYFANRLRGGAGMVVTDPPAILPGQAGERIIAWNDSMAGDLSRLAEVAHQEGSFLLTQIQDAGRGRHVPGRSANAMAPSALPDDLSYTMPRAMGGAEIEAFVESAAQSALRLKGFGFAGAEISAGHGHLIHQFLSPRSNQREDAYGGDLAGRCKFLVDLCIAIRAACGADFILGVKLPGDDGIADSITPARAFDIAAHLVSAVHCDYLTYAQGTHHRTLEMHLPDDSAPRMTYLGLFRELRKATPGVPVMALGRITDPAEAEGIVARGEAELVGLGRALIVDPAWPDKALRGRARDIRYCVSCNTCWKAINADSSLKCDNNPLLATSDELVFKPAAASVRKHLVVVGAGVAGLEAAWTAAARGHRVTVLGSGAEVGGKARLQAQLPGSESLSSVYDYQYTAALKAGVHFELGLTACVDDVLSRGAQEVVLATGSTMTWPVCLPAHLREEGWIPDLREAMADMVQRGRGTSGHGATDMVPDSGTAVILDMDQTEGTYAAAELLKQRFSRVVILTQRQGIAEDMVLMTRQRILRRFFELGIEVMPLVEPRWSSSFEDEGRLEVASVFGPTVRSIDNVAFFSYATPRRPNNTLHDALLAAGLQVHVIGDCKLARDVLAATSEGSAAGMRI